MLQKGRLQFNKGTKTFISKKKKEFEFHRPMFQTFMFSHQR